MTLQAGQKLIGEGVALTNTDVGTATVETLFAAGTKPGPDRLGRRRRHAGVQHRGRRREHQPRRRRQRPHRHVDPSGVTLRSMEINDTGTAATQPGLELTTAGNGLTLSGTVDVAMQSNKALDINGAALSGAFANVTTTASHRRRRAAQQHHRQPHVPETSR